MKNPISGLDLRLGLRMLFKHPGITAVGVLALTVALALGAAWFEFTRELIEPRIPLADGDRIVTLRNWDAARGGPEPRSLHDFEQWRAELRTVEEIGVATLSRRALATDDGRSASASAAEVTAAGLRLTRVQPVLGRPLLEDDERPDAPPVVVLGHEIWQRLFDGDRAVLGRTLRVGATISTVVGVMPEGFGFPINQEIWLPFRARALDHAPLEGPAIIAFGRLAGGVTLDDAQAEITAIGRRTAAASPETHSELRPRVEPFSRSFIGGGPLVRTAMNLPFLLLLIVICANVATLIFSRTASRSGELALRSALGASRGRLLLQLILEALVLTSLAALLATTLAGWGIAWGMTLFWEIQESRPPFWFDPGLSASTVLYTAALALLAAILIGGVPALKATRGELRAGLAQGAVAGRRLRFGGFSTVAIVIQVALCVIFLPISMARAYDALGGRAERVAFPADRYLTGRLALQSADPGSVADVAGGPAPALRAAELREQISRRIAAVPGVAAVTFASRIPGMNHPYELVGIGDALTGSGPLLDTAARALEVDLSFFEAMEAPILAGRGFIPSDLDSPVGSAVVDRTFVREYMRGRDPVGEVLTYPNRPGGEERNRYQIVGVVEDLPMNSFGPGGYQDLIQMQPAGYVGVYHPLRPGDHIAAQLFLRFRTHDPAALVATVQNTVTALDPALSLEGLATVAETWRPAHRGERFLTWMIALIAAVVVGLSAAGIYALMSFAVSQRTREIGIRTALGADRTRIVLAIFSRAFAQVGAGVLLGAIVIGIAAAGTGQGLGLVAAMAVLMIGVGMLACVAPASRALSIEPIEALRGDG